MQLQKKLSIAAAFIAVILLSGCGLSLAGDVTPPPNYIAPTEFPTGVASGSQPAGSQTVFPLVPPDPSQGAAIFAEKCLPCHGAKGMGDGPQAANLPNQPAPIGSPDFARSARPVDWFNTVTSGNLQKYMPGFSGSLNDRQRWDVVAYALSLSAAPEVLQKGKAAYEQNCATCHGATGQGDGPQAAGLSAKPVAWNKDQSLLAQLSEDDIAAVMTGARQGHPSFASTIDETLRYQVSAYVRSLTFANAGQPAEVASLGKGTEPASALATQASQVSTSEPAATGQAGQKITITGQVTNGTPGGKVPPGLKVDLLAYSGMQAAFDQTASTAADGSYRFDNVQLDPNFVYYAQVNANGLVFNSDILHATDVKGAQANLPVQIYETAADPSVLRVDRMHIFFDFSKAGLVQVVNLYVITNPTDRVIIAEPRDKPVIQFDLPQGASNLQFQDGTIGDGRYVQTENGFGDTQAVIPGNGQHQVLFAYEMPYNNKLDVNLKTPLPVDAAVVMVPPSGVKLKSGQLTDSGQQNVQGMSFRMYQSTSSLKKGDALNVSLSGSANSGGTDNTSILYLLIGIGTFGLVLVGAGVWMYRRRALLAPVAAGGEELLEETGEAGSLESSEVLLDAILAVDDLHASGKLPDAAYQERRAGLKARLADVLEREKGGS